MGGKLLTKQFSEVQARVFSLRLFFGGGSFLCTQALNSSFSCFNLCKHYNIILKDIRAPRKEKEIKATKLQRNKFVSANDKSLSEENLRLYNTYKKLLELINQLSKVAGYKINI